MFSSIFDKNAFLSGMMRTLDLGSTVSSIKTHYVDPKEIDYLAISADWEAVSVNLNAALANYVRESKLSDETQEQET